MISFAVQKYSHIVLRCKTIHNEKQLIKRWAEPETYTF